MTVLKIIILAVAMVAAITLRAAGIGQWRAYMAYHDIQDAVHGGNNTIYVLASNDLYAVNTADGSLTTYDKGERAQRLRNYAHSMEQHGQKTRHCLL